MRMAIYGAGSLGIILGAYITKAGHEIDLINRNKQHVDALQKNGATVTGKVQMQVPVSAITPDAMQGTYDLIFLMTKQVQNPEIVAFLKPFLAEDGILCTLQNGLPEPGIAEILGGERVAGCIVEWGATLQGPGVSELTSEPDSLSFGIGSVDGKSAGKLDMIKGVLESMCPVHVEENFIGDRWSKLLINASFSGMSAVTGGTFGGVAADNASRRCIQYLMKECIDVSRAAGVTMAPVQGKDIAKLLDFKGKVKQWIAFQIIPIAIKKHAALKASMLQDLQRRAKTEVDFINGVVSHYGREHGVATPFNDRVVKIVHEIEAGEKKTVFNNVSLFADLLRSKA